MPTPLASCSLSHQFQNDQEKQLQKSRSATDTTALAAHLLRWHHASLISIQALLACRIDTCDMPGVHCVCTVGLRDGPLGSCRYDLSWRQVNTDMGKGL